MTGPIRNVSFLIDKKEMGENPPNNFSTKFYWIYPKGLKKINRFLHESLLKIWDFFHECEKTLNFSHEWKKS
jgi:hypothetical protein